MSYGKSHEVQPDADALCTVAFEESPLDPEARRVWMLNAADAIAFEVADTPAAFRAFEGILDTLGEEAAWRYLDEYVQHAGFDTYDSDALFQVFEGGTPEAV